MANFEALCWGIKLRINPVFLKSDNCTRPVHVIAFLIIQAWTILSQKPKKRQLEDKYTDLQSPTLEPQSEFIVCCNPQNHHYSVQSVKGIEVGAYKGMTSMASSNCILNTSTTSNTNYINGESIVIVSEVCI